jgi:hypothetical protein
MIPVIIFSAYASSVPCDDRVDSTLCKASASLENLVQKVRDRLALPPAKVA